MTCAVCRGLGSPWAVAGHCFDIDGGLWHLPGECTAPECRDRPCCAPCLACGGSGRDDRLRDPLVMLGLLDFVGCPFDWTIDGNGAAYVWPVPA